MTMLELSPTTTTPAPTTSLPPRKKDCYWLGDVDKLSYDPFVMNKDYNYHDTCACVKYPRQSTGLLFIR